MGLGWFTTEPCNSICFKACIVVKKLRPEEENVLAI